MSHVIYMKKNKFVDDQRSFTNMDVKGISKKYDLQNSKKKPKEQKLPLCLNQSEEKALYKASLKAMIIPISCALVGFLITFGIIWLWLFV